MNLLTAIALLEALSTAAGVIVQIINDRRAAGHPENAPLSPEHENLILKALKDAAEAIPHQHQEALGEALDRFEPETWADTHGPQGG